MNYLEKAKSYEDAFLQDLKDIIRIPSLRNVEEATENAPFGPQCRKVLDVMLEKAKKDGFQVKDYQGYAGVIEYGEGEESVGILGHLDIVPIGEDWSRDPLGCEMEDGYVFGRGVLDDKGPTLCAYYALKMLKEQGFHPNKKIMLIMGCDEESGMGCMDYYCKHGEIPTIGFTPDANFPLIYGEKGILNFHICFDGETVIKKMTAGGRANVVIAKACALVDNITDEQKNLFSFYLESNGVHGEIREVPDGIEIEIQGLAQHSAYCYNGVNAGLLLLNFIASAYQDSLSKQLYDLCKDWKGTGLNIALEGAFMGFLTMNTGVISIENGHVDTLIDIRYPNDISGSELIIKVEECIKNKNYPFVLKDIHDSKPLFVDPKSNLITTLEGSYRKYSGDDFTPIQTIGGGTYARKFDNFVAFGPEFPKKEETSFYVGGPHEKDEGMKLSQLLQAMAIYADAIEQLSK